MIEITGNMWDIPADLRFVTTNGNYQMRHDVPYAIMGGGCAKEAKDRYSFSDAILGGRLHQYGNHCYRLAKDLASFPTKDNYWEKSKLDLIWRSCGEAVTLITNLGYKKVLLPRPGVGLGGLDWEEVKPIVSELDDRFHIVTWG
jgi:hypothetical protein